MVTVSDSVEIPASPEQVVGTIADLDSWADWLVVHVGFTEGRPDKVAPGVTFRQRVRILGMPGEVEWTVTEMDLGDPARISMEGKGTMGTKMETRFTIASEGEGTKVFYDASYGGAALTPLLGQLEKATKEASAESLQKLRDLVVSRATA